MRIDAAGRLVNPKQVRSRLGLEAGAELELEEVGDHVELRPIGREVWLDESGDRPVFRAVGDVPTLTAAEVRELMDEFRR
ncbi:AbrB family looped-hinge helix DNA binding protein [Pseudonocardia eucalypti]|uniref:AbrB/MazE/SpoVT family DNA-binding domain-containing protein n=1 Tax=Pseudonocardia eucalypti TaxID=648755 RepID=UPI00161CA52B|nr:AbrB family looped-hinge helix DNA binding protein [Pseudonocardia eucalypti]